MSDRKFYVISYDIVDDRKRAKAAEVLKDYGRRVQKSVYEARLDAKTLAKVKERLQAVIDKTTDNVVLYLQCEACLKQKGSMGLPITGEEEDFRVL